MPRVIAPAQRAQKSRRPTGVGLNLILLAITPGVETAENRRCGLAFRAIWGVEKTPCLWYTWGVIQPNTNQTDKGAISLQSQDTTKRPKGQAKYWTRDEQGRIYHTVKADELPLVDWAPNGRVKPWRVHHRDGLLLAEVYSSMAELIGGADEVISYSSIPGIADKDGQPIVLQNKEREQNPAAKWLDKARRLEQCASFAEFQRLPDGSLRLHDASFCRVRLCPMCQWRRSLKLGAQVRQVVERANAQHIAETQAPWRWLMVTFTVRNIEGPDLGAEIDRLHKAINNMAKCAKWRAAVKGWLRATEVTHNLKSDTYHPHMHMLLCVPSSYFSGKGYITQKGWQTLWAHYAGTDYAPVVDVRAIKPATGERLSDLPAGEQAAAMGKACAEVSKYAAKPGDYIIPQDWAMSMQTVQLLDSMLNKRRMTSWGGILKDIAQSLKLDDAETGDLVHIDEDASEDQTANKLAQYVAYSWSMGARDYLPTYKREGASEDVERAERAADRKAHRAARREQAATEWQEGLDIIDLYMQAAGWDPKEQAKARHALQTLPRSVIERQLREYKDAIILPDGWEDDTP